MTDQDRPGPSSGKEDGPDEPVVIRDKRRFDPKTGEVRGGQQAQEDSVSNDSEETSGSDSAFGGAVGDDLPGGKQPSSPQDAGVPTDPSFVVPDDASSLTDEHPDTVLARERLEDVRRVQAEYVNYKRRVDRDRETQRDAQTARIVESLLPVLDDFHLAREHGDLAGTPFEKIADKLETTLGRHGLERFGEPGEAFDPAQHEALMNVEADLPDGTTATTVVQVMQPGYRIGDRVVRPARVAVADPT
ncbi:nucleotide exchange factor GrpE [Allobranchiibius sp. GilTou38]|uniref:nucleotide exchange factor GrpE n=1 Tax=Allobranchiibius sp. GilTou38 TaxID=2815210 RepID=UPI001AA12EAF|nr:nucleotide exchange factor GrpE [Allobranchiibius sp. GilTou38]